MQVMDIHGRIVHKESMNNLGGKVSKSIDLSDEPSGTYLLRFINGEQVKKNSLAEIVGMLYVEKLKAYQDIINWPNAKIGIP